MKIECIASFLSSSDSLGYQTTRATALNFTLGKMCNLAQQFKSNKKQT